MKPKSWFESANLAIEGILYAARTQRHMRWHFLAAVGVLVASLVLGISEMEFIALTLAILFVLLAEMVNTALEATVDLVSEAYHPLAKVVKDVAAGAVLLAAIGAAVVGYLVLYPHVAVLFHRGLSVAKGVPEHLTLIALIVVVILVVVAKAYVGRGKPLRGGLPSGHAAVSFAIWVAVVYLTEHALVSLLTLVMAILVSRSRITQGIHDLKEVTLGALLGSAVTFALFQIFR